MDEQTIAAYEQSAVAYGDHRRAYHPARAATFAARLAPGDLRLDLGCGPGHYLPHLGQPVVGLDAAVAMVGEARRRHPGTAVVAGDIEALPFRHGALAGVWASKSLQHIAAERLPRALGELHGVLTVGGTLDVTVFDRTGDRPDDDVRPDDGGDGYAAPMVTRSDDDFPGRLFSFWSPERLTDLLVGAGFTVEEAAVPTPDEAVVRVVARATRARSLADSVGPGMRMLVCGLNPSLYAADRGVGFARTGNRFWPAALTAGLVSAPRAPRHALDHHGLGMTDLVKRATVSATELTPAEYRTGLARVRRLVGWLRPRAVCFVGLSGWRAAVDRHARSGPQPTPLAGAPVYVMPSTSGLNARSSPASLADHLRAAAAMADGA